MAFLRPNKLSVIERCPYYRGVHKERLDCKESEESTAGVLFTEVSVEKESNVLTLADVNYLC